jgi:predicted Mrr-cat superfamily restriction endonuclease
MNVWRLISHHEDRAGAVAWTKKNGRIAIGWGIIGDIRAHNYQSADEIADAIRVAYRTYKHPVRNFHSGGHSLWDLYASMKDGDLVILAGTTTRELVVEIEGPYEWRENTPLAGDNYNHQRRARVRNLNPELVWRAAGARYVEGASVYRTLIRLAKPLSEDDV